MRTEGETERKESNERGREKEGERGKTIGITEDEKIQNISRRRRRRKKKMKKKKKGGRRRSSTSNMIRTSEKVEVKRTGKRREGN